MQLITPRGLTDGAAAKVTGVFIGWPTRTSLRSLELHVAGQPHSFRYNPERAGGGGLEWRDVPMTAEPPPVGGEMRLFRSPPMILSIPRPGELYRQERLSGEVEVTIDRLLSGTRARLFDSTGRQCQRPSLEIETSRRNGVLGPARGRLRGRIADPGAREIAVRSFALLQPPTARATVGGGAVVEFQRLQSHLKTWTASPPAAQMFTVVGSDRLSY